MSKYELSLSASYVPGWDVYDAVREFFQNALDQEELDISNRMMCSYNKETATLSIGSKKSRLTKASLLLGVSTKTDEVNTIGQFGEGYKLASLVAIRTGHTISIKNYADREIWTPRFVKSKRYGTDILTFFVEKSNSLWQKAPDQDLTIEIGNITAETYQEIVNRNLHLQDIQTPVKITPKGEILMDVQYKGRIYVNGLYVCTNDSFNYGYNIWPAHLKLDRDRKMISDFDLAWCTSSMWANVDTELLLKVVKKGQDDTKYLSQVSSNNYNLYESALLDFRKDYGSMAIPVSANSELADVQKSYPNALAVLVSETQKNLILKAADYTINSERRKLEGTKLELIQTWYEDIQWRLTTSERRLFEDIMSIEETPEATKEELGDRLCPYCEESVHGVMNTGPHDLCEGRFCDDAYEVYLEKVYGVCVNYVAAYQGVLGLPK